MSGTISQIFGITASILGILSLQLKGIRSVLICQLLCNLTGAVSYLLLGGDSGCCIYFAAVLQSLVYLIYNIKKKTAPSYFSVVFVVLFLICSALTFKGPADIISALAAITCALALSAKKPFHYRLCLLFNGLIWLCYDLVVGAYGMVLTHIAVAVSAIIGMVRLDFPEMAKKKRCPTETDEK